jgi:hypothetical protein
MTLFRIDQRFVEALEDIVLDVAQTEASDLCTDASNEIIAAGSPEHPVKEIRFHDPTNTGILEDLTGEQIGGRGKLGAEESASPWPWQRWSGSCAGKQRIIVDAGAIYEAESLGAGA